MKTAAYRQAEKHCREAEHLSHGPAAGIPAAWQHVHRALELDPDHASASVLAGDLWLYEYDEIGSGDHSERSAAETALPYFERALEVEPLHADAWAGKAHALCRLERYEEALAAAQAGLAALPHGIDYLWHPEVYAHVDRELRGAMVSALLGLGRRAAAWKALEEALSWYPEHWYLEPLRARFEEAGPEL